jgi:hypothetical protein
VGPGNPSVNLMPLEFAKSHQIAARCLLQLCPLECSMMECNEFAGKVIVSLTLYEEGDYGPEVNIEFTDGTTFNICFKTEASIEAKHICDEGGEPRVLGDYSRLLRNSELGTDN